jgi:hypothetical protein
MLNTNGIGNDEFLEYKGRPLVRHGDDIYYGNLSDKYYILMTIMGDKKNSKNDELIPGQTLVQLIESETKKPVADKQKLTNGLAEAFEYADAWLERSNK